MDTKTETDTKTASENGAAGQVQGTRTPLAKVVPVIEDRADLFNPKRWTQSDIDTIKHAVCPKGIPDAEFKLFIMRCQASGMNPLLGEAFCVERNIKVGGTRDNPIWGKTFVFTPGEQGMEARADDFPDYKGLRAAAVYSKDKIVIDASTGEISHQFNPAEDRGRLMGAWAIAYREGRVTPVEFVKLEEYVDLKNLKWASSPHTMIVKCARAAALRRAYPNAFNGVYVREELRDDVEQQLEAGEAAAAKSTADVLAERMKATGDKQAELGAQPSKSPSKASTSTVDVVKQPAPTNVTPLRPVSHAGPSTTNADPVVAEAKRIIERCEALKLNYDGQKLLEDRHYREAKAEEVEKLAKRAAGAISENSMEGAAKAGPPPVADGPVMVYGGAFKGRQIKTLSGPEIVDLMKLGNDKLKDLDDKKKAKVLQNLSELKAALEARDRALIEEGEKPVREPGSDDDID